MRIDQRFVVARPVEEVWAFLADVPAVAECIPGAELQEDLGGGTYRGRFAIKVGPVTAKLEGESRLERDDASRTGRIHGKGVDKRGGSRVTGTMSYGVVEAPEGAAVEIAADVNLTGPLAQVGRIGIIEDVARRLTGEFATALAGRLATRQGPAGAPSPAAGIEGPREAARMPEPAQPFDAGRALAGSLWTRLLAWFKRLLGGGNPPPRG